VPQQSSFYGAPWLAGLLGGPGITGPTISQAWRDERARRGDGGDRDRGWAQRMRARRRGGSHQQRAARRLSQPGGFGGKPDAEDWVWDNFNRDPWAKNAMIQTAENVAKEAGITREEQDEIALAALRAISERHGQGA
jgi:hypothetical protein